MTNLEFYKDEIRDRLDDHNLDCATCKIRRKSTNCSYDSCCDERLRSLDWLLAEHKEPIKLTQWEKDMLEIRKNLDVLYHCTLENNLYFCELKNKGYFKNVDLSKTAEDILNNCEVVENVD